MSLKQRLGRFRSFWLFPALALTLVSFTHRITSGSRIQDLVWLIPVGIVSWTLLEYILHRFVFHRDFQGGVLQRLMNGQHISLHRSPREVEYILVHTSFALAASGLIYLIVLAITRDIFQAMGVMTGIWSGFLYYESVHYRVHMTSGSAGVIDWQRRVHF